MALTVYDLVPAHAIHRFHRSVLLPPQRCKLNGKNPLKFIQQSGLPSQKHINPQHHPPRHQPLMIIGSKYPLHFKIDTPPMTKCPLELFQITDTALQERKELVVKLGMQVHNISFQRNKGFKRSKLPVSPPFKPLIPLLYAMEDCWE